MIRLRKTDGTVIQTPADAPFVELVNDSDGAIMLVFAQVGPGAILKINPGSEDAARYEIMFRKQGVAFQTSMIERRSG